MTCLEHILRFGMRWRRHDGQPVVASFLDVARFQGLLLARRDEFETIVVDAAK